MSPKSKKHSPQAAATRKRKREARRQTRQSFSSSESPTKRGRDAQSEPSSPEKRQVTADKRSQATEEPKTPERVDSPTAPATPLSQANLVAKVKDTNEAYTVHARDSPKVNHHPEPSGINPAEEHSDSAPVLSRPGAVHMLGDAVQTDEVKAKKKAARPARALVLHIPAVTHSCGLSIDDTEEPVATSSPLSNRSPSPSKNSGVRTPTRSRSPSKLIFGVGLGSSSGLLSELPFYKDSPGKRYDDRMGQALAPSPMLASMDPPDSSPTLGSRSPYAFHTSNSPTLDHLGSPSAGVARRRTDSQLLDSPSARAITDAIDRRDSDIDGTSWLRAGNHGKAPRAALGTLYEKPASHFPGPGSVSGGSSKPSASPERKSLAKAFDHKVDPAAPVPVPIDEFLKSCAKGSPGKGDVVGSSRNMSAGTASEGDYYIQPGDGSPRLRTRHLVSLAPPDVPSPEALGSRSDEEESELELSDKENM